ncbi:hypothetical protein BpHYR1_013321 [Brachionus plicatilis]|uniref:Uncharacterized protein n=1 Tax=Brachionus plicatilis TaxID=10195 RepID=A0A3M7QT12_BRAPC|nr:hypothetical protein BpHYR1_013321 [Brachionus plicatilis]
MLSKNCNYFRKKKFIDNICKRQSRPFLTGTLINNFDDSTLEAPNESISYDSYMILSRFEDQVGAGWRLEL